MLLLYGNNVNIKLMGKMEDNFGAFQMFNNSKFH
jgi:hypothetical protein